MKKDFYKIVVAVGFFVFSIGLLIDSIMFEELSLEIISAYSILAAFGFAFVFSSNATINRFGYSFCAFAGIYGLANIMFVPLDTVVADIGAVIMLAGVAIHVAMAIPGFFGYCKASNSAAVGQVDVYDQLLNYSKLLAEDVIDEREYENLKAKLFGEHPLKNAKNNYDELKKWKEIAEKKLISENEYNSLKAKILNLK